MDESGEPDVLGVPSDDLPASSTPDRMTTYCGWPGCSTLREIAKVTESHRFPVQERVELAASGGAWEETDRVAYTRTVRLECGHSKGLVGV